MKKNTKILAVLSTAMFMAAVTPFLPSRPRHRICEEFRLDGRKWKLVLLRFLRRAFAGHLEEVRQ